MNKFIIKCWDGYIYIIETKFETAVELDNYLAQHEKVQMPNGDLIKYSSIDKISSDKSYSFQQDQIARHKKGQRINLKSGDWRDVTGHSITSAKLENITGKAKALGEAKSKKRLTT